MTYNLDAAIILDSQVLKSEFDINSKVFDDIKQHGKRVARLSTLIGKEMDIGENELKTLNQSALLHDYGKYYIPRNILLKPSKLSAVELRMMRKHAYYGSQIALSKGESEDIATSILYHHENYNGTGYYGVQKDFIPFCSRIIKIADIYDALTSVRPYREALNICTALEIMKSEKDHYDPEIYEIFIKKIAGKLQ